MSVLKRLPIGISDFKEIVEGNLYFMDKSLMIQDLIEDSSKVTLLTRPRRFGKTLNMSMIKNFFEKTEEDKSYLFKDLKIWEDEQAREYFCKYPVIYITFKDMKDNNFNKMYEKLKEAISIEYGKYGYLLESGILNQAEIAYYNDILLKRASQAQYETSLKNLSAYLNKYHKQKVIILIDEYDVPIQNGYLNKYYDEIIEFIRNFLSGGLKDNENLQNAVLTGILRVAKESIFSGLNNLTICSILSEEYSKYFGFTEEEVEELLKYYGIEYKLNDIKSWYNGYIFGETVIYNPWSMINFVKEYKKGLVPHWVNTSDNSLIKKLIIGGGQRFKSDIEKLLKGETVEKIVDENVVFTDLDENPDTVWSFLLFTGYLKVIDKSFKNRRLVCTLKIPNFEV
jgi:hypothetical protein